MRAAAAAVQVAGKEWVALEAAAQVEEGSVAAAMGWAEVAMAGEGRAWAVAAREQVAEGMETEVGGRVVVAGEAAASGAVALAAAGLEGVVGEEEVAEVVVMATEVEEMARVAAASVAVARAAERRVVAD